MPGQRRLAQAQTQYIRVPNSILVAGQSLVVFLAYFFFCVLFMLCFAGYHVSLVIGIPVPGCSRLVYQHPHAPKKNTARRERV